MLTAIDFDDILTLIQLGHVYLQFYKLFMQLIVQELLLLSFFIDIEVPPVPLYLFLTFIKITKAGRSIIFR